MRDAIGDGIRNALATACRIQEQEPEQEKSNKPIVGRQAPDDARVVEQGSKLTARRQAEAAAERLIAYLNEKAGTRFHAVEANVKLAMARMLYDGASEQDLRAVVDLKVAEAARGEFDRKYLRPGTLFNAEKFAQYIGQANARAPATPRIEPVSIYAEYDDAKRRHVTDYPPGDADAMARRALAEYGSTPWMQNARNLVMRMHGSEHRFSIVEMRNGNGSHRASVAHGFRGHGL
jgi:uncharacterized phage protein (TIGR02220 family)